MAYKMYERPFRCNHVTRVPMQAGSLSIPLLAISNNLPAPPRLTVPGLFSARKSIEPIDQLPYYTEEFKWMVRVTRISGRREDHFYYAGQPISYDPTPKNLFFYIDDKEMKEDFIKGFVSVNGRQEDYECKQCAVRYECVEWRRWWEVTQPVAGVVSEIEVNESTEQDHGKKDHYTKDCGYQDNLNQAFTNDRDSHEESEPSRFDIETAWSQAMAKNQKGHMYERPFCDHILTPGGNTHNGNMGCQPSFTYLNNYFPPPPCRPVRGIPSNYHINQLSWYVEVKRICTVCPLKCLPTTYYAGRDLQGRQTWEHYFFRVDILVAQQDFERNYFGENDSKLVEKYRCEKCQVEYECTRWSHPKSLASRLSLETTTLPYRGVGGQGGTS